MKPLLTVKIPGVKKRYSGKVRDLYTVDKEHLLIVSTDRISAFDHVFPTGIPGKGIILNKISNLWFKNIKVIKNHIVEDNFNNFPKPFSNYPELLKDRSVIVRKTERIDFECIARGYLIGTGWKDYKATGSVCGIPLPPDIQLAQKLDAPLFTPATKEDSGHDINVPVDVMRARLGEELAYRLGESTLRIYEYARDLVDRQGIILADTKFEFGFADNEIILIDEVLTPDSSRFWDKASYSVGTSPVSFDKQFIRDYLETTTWDKNSPPPPLPEEIVQKTMEKYEEILHRIEAVFAR
jgi:phosphoribosylaminoimidazole-succinocarboxamide synthase